MKERKTKLLLLIIFLFILCIFTINPVFPNEIYLQHIPTIILTGFLVYGIIKNSISNTAFLCLVLFLIFHTIGARWNYSFIPYDKWIQSSLGFSVDGYFHFKRNHYDRLVHFMYGFLMIIPVSELYVRKIKLPQNLSYHVAFLFVLSSSLIYELIEWTLAVFMSPEDAEAYNGQQGDMWDAQKDMALAMFGAVIMILVINAIRKIRLIQLNK